jgi:hypothetical protein
LCAECNGARGNVDHLWDEGSQLGEALRAGQAESSSWEAEARLVQAGLELVRERYATGGQPPLLHLHRSPPLTTSHSSSCRAPQIAHLSVEREGRDG